MSHRLRTRGFTLVELLVVIAIIGILVALLLPAIQAARQAALKNSCRNNMKQLALACQNHNDTFKTFPSVWFSNVTGTTAGAKGDMSVGGGAKSYSWIVRLLPFIEEDTLYKSISAKSSKFTLAAGSQSVLVPTAASTTGENPGRIKLGQILCPSYSGETESTAAAPAANQATNYVAVSATVTQRMNYSGTIPSQTNATPPDGMIIQDKLARGQSMARMADGTSKTLVIAESKEGTTANNAATTFFEWYRPERTFVTGWGTGQGCSASATAGSGKPSFNTTGGWVPVGTTDTSGLNFGPSPGQTPVVKFDSTAPTGGVARSYGPSSDHMGGIVIVGMGDGSVQELTDTGTDPKIIFAAITTRGGENVGGIGQ